MTVRKSGRANGLRKLREETYPGTIRYYLVLEDGEEQLKTLVAADFEDAVAQLDDIGKFIDQDWTPFPRLHQWR
jgi:hypothetical protein